MAESRYPHLCVRVSIMRGTDMLLSYTFWLDNDSERRSFAMRCTEAWLAGQTIITSME